MTTDAPVCGRRVAVRRLVGAIAFVIAGCSPALDWREVSVGEAVVALFPCKVERRVRDGVALGGLRVQMTQWSCSASGMRFAVSRAVLPPGASGASAVHAWVEASVQNLEGVAGAPTEVAIRGAPAPGERRAVAGRSPDGGALTHEMLLFARGQSVFQASVIGASLRSDAVEGFFEGLEFRR